MFNTLLESKARTQRSAGGSLVSLTLHASLIVLAIQATLHAGQPSAKVAADLTYVDVKRNDVPPPQRKAPDVRTTSGGTPTTLMLTAPGTPTPRYPDLLKLSGVEGEVIVSFVVDTTGRADLRSLTILKSAHELFTAAVKAALPGMRFIPAEAGGRKVRQLVLLPFWFNIVK